MGELKKIVEHSVKHLNNINPDFGSKIFYDSYKEKFKKLEGKKAVWRTKNSPVIKAPKLVTIIHAYDYHVLVSGLNITYDGSHNYLNYSIEYSSLLSGFDTLRILK